jgi:parallel beta-helix repeat protein
LDAVIGTYHLVTQGRIGLYTFDGLGNVGLESWGNPLDEANPPLLGTAHYTVDDSGKVELFDANISSGTTVPECFRLEGRLSADGNFIALNDINSGCTPYASGPLRVLYRVADGDNDGLPDAWEVANGLSPLAYDSYLDLDRDGLTNFEEYQNSTDPNDADSDNDGLIDGEEVKIYLSNPLNPDTDGDGMPDGWEATNGLNPLLDDAGGDPDNDFYTNHQEFLAGTDPRDSQSRPALFAEFQTIPTSGATAWESFFIGNELYLAVANRSDGSSGNIDSHVYKWNGSAFQLIQSIPTQSARDWESFMIDGESYLAVANYFNGASYRVNSKIYKWNGTSFLEYQSVPSIGVADWESFRINGETYLALANSVDDGDQRNLDSKIFKWNGAEFVEVQSIPTHSASAWKSFEINGVTYLAVGNYFNNSSYDLDSVVYRWNGSSFAPVQNIPTHAVTDIEAFEISGQRYLAVANHYLAGWNTFSKIYRWEGSSFVEVQALQTLGATDLESFVINGEVYLAVANSYNGSTLNVDSKIYKWSGSAFVEIQSIPTHGAWEWESFLINGRMHVAVANSGDGSSNNIDSKIYVYTGSVLPGFDTDEDGLTDEQEALLGTNPHNPDTDNDGLTDGEEVNTYGTNPLNNDTDSDGRNDGQEVASGTNPNDGTSFIGIPLSERAALVTLYSSTAGDTWTNRAGWKEGTLYADGFQVPGTECTWFGISCSGQHVTQIVLRTNNLSGELPSVSGLTSLQFLDLSYNQLSGEIPSVSGLTSLVVLLLYNNQLSGNIPSLSGLTSLRDLYLNNNQLTGEIPSLSGLTRLEMLYLYDNQLSGEIPSLSGLTSLVGLGLAINHLSGEIPSLSGLTSLGFLDLSYNHLSGEIPSLSGLTSLWSLYLWNNHLSGEIPSLSGLTSLRDLYLSNNQLSGKIPDTVGTLASLRYIGINGNKLTGEIPNTFTLQNLPNMQADASNIGWNALTSTNTSVRSLLTFVDPDWENTQTIAPANLQSYPTSYSAISLTWDVILYAADLGGYEIELSTESGGPYSLYSTTGTKSETTLLVTGLAPETEYFFRVRSFTNPHPNNLNTVYSEYTGEVSTTTLSLPSDSDGDGLPDDWEVANFGNLSQGPSDDPDGDGWPNLAEYRGGTIPNNVNSAPSKVVFHVDPSAGNDADLGEATSPLRTLHGAIARVNNLPEGSYTIYLASGTYSRANGEPDEPLSIENNVIILGSDTFVDGSGVSNWVSGFVVSPGAANVTIQDVTIQGFGTGIAINTDGACLHLSGVTVEQCGIGIGMFDSHMVDVDLGTATIANNQNGILIGGSSSNISIWNGIVKQNTYDGIMIEGWPGLPDENLLQGVEVLNNGRNGIAILDGRATQVVDCVVQGNNTSEQGFGGIAVLTGGVTIRGTDIIGNHCFGVYADQALSTEPLDARYNWWGDASGPSGMGPGSGDAVSEFVAFSPWTGMDASGDADRDGWSNLAEFQAGTDPNNANSHPLIVEFYVGGRLSDDQNLGDKDHPFKTYHAALKQISGLAQNNYTVHLTPAVYSVGTGEPDQPVTLDQNTTLVGPGAVFSGAGAANWNTALIVGPGAARVLIQGITLRDFETGIGFATDAACLTLSGVSIDGCGIGVEIRDNHSLNIDLANAVITGCRTGIEIGGGSSNNTIRNGIVTLSANDGILIDGGLESPDENLIEGVQVIANGRNGIAVFDGKFNRISKCLIDGNNTSETGFGGLAVLTGGVTVNQSDIQNNHCLGVYADEALSTEPLDATYNWWGHSSGPSGAGPGTGDAVTEFVNFTPWLRARGGVDTDRDGMPDYWESAYGLNPNDPGDAAKDLDGDGWPNRAEFEAGTDPANTSSMSGVTEFFVARTQGSDANLGTTDYPLKTLHGAVNRINSLPAGSYSIHLLPGVYSVETGEADSPLSLMQNVTIQGQGAFIRGADARGWTHGMIMAPGAEKVSLNGVVVENFSSGLVFETDGACLNLSNVTVERCGIGLGIMDSSMLTIDLGNAVITNCETGIGIFAGSSNNTIRNGSVLRNTGDGILLEGSVDAPSENRIEFVDVIANERYGVALMDGSGNVVADCLISGNNVGRQGMGGMAILGGSASVMYNVIQGNFCTGVYADEQASAEISGNLILGSSDGIKLGFTSDVAVKNNTITENQRGLVVDDGSSPAVLYNILWGNSSGDLVVDGTYTSIDYNDIGTTNLPQLPTGTYNISADPVFVDAPGGNYSLGYVSGVTPSPCIDAAGITTPGRDLAGQARPYGTYWDMGAYESHGIVQSDADHLPDWWEMTYFATTLQGDESDFDGDGLTNWQEYLAGTDPTVVNTVMVLITSPALDPAFAASGTTEFILDGISMNAYSVALLNIKTGVTVPAMMNADGSWVGFVTLSSGENVFIATGYGAGGLSAQDSARVIVDNASPVVTIISPTTTDTYVTGLSAITVTGLALDDTAVTAVSWTRTAPGPSIGPNSATGTQEWTAAAIPLVADADNVIEVTAADAFGNYGRAVLTVRREPLNIVNQEGDGSKQARAVLEADTFDKDGDNYHNEDETACGSDPLDNTSMPANTRGAAWPTDDKDPNFRLNRVKKDASGKIIGSYLWPDLLNPDDDLDGLPDLWEEQYFLTKTGADRYADPDNDTFTNFEEYRNGTHPLVPQAVGFSMTIPDGWLPTYQGVLRVAATWTGGGTPPPTVYFSLKETSAYPGRAVNDPDPAITRTNYPSGYQYHGYDFGLTTDPSAPPATPSYSQGPVAVNGTGVYEIYIQSWDYGGRTRVVVGNQPTDPAYMAEMWVPMGSGKNGIGSAWQYSNNGDLDANADTDQIVFEKSGKAPVGDDFSNFEEYRGIVYTENGTLQHKRLNPNRKDLFIRGEGFSDAYPFAIGNALANAGIDVHDTTLWGHDATEDRSFFTTYRRGTITGIQRTDSGAFVTGTDTEWASTWPSQEWEFRLDADGATADAWVPVSRWISGGELYLGFAYPGTGTGGTYAIRKPVPHINVLIVRNDTVTRGFFSWEDGHIRFVGVSKPGDLFVEGARQWAWSTKGYSRTQNTLNQPFMYGAAAPIQYALEQYFADKPYIDGMTWTGNGWTGRDGKLQPLNRVEDQNDNMQMDENEDALLGGGMLGQLDGDCRTDNKDTWSSSEQVSPFDINNNGKVELPFASDPNQVRESDEYDLRHVWIHTITHEICHALAGDSHSSDPRCLMYGWSTDWKRQDFLSDGYRALLRVHNIKRWAW